MQACSPSFSIDRKSLSLFSVWLEIIAIFFLQIIPVELQNIEQAFAKHDWQVINASLQNMKPVMQELNLRKNETLINEINDHVNANATNRAVVKLLQVKSSSTKIAVAIKEILGANK